jgi:hypothetical protein
MDKINWTYVLLGAFYTFLAQGGAWMQHNLQFKFPSLGPTWWGWYVLSIPLTWLFLTATKYTVTAFHGQIWANRFIGFSIGIIVYAILTSWLFNQHITVKVGAQLLLAFGILLIQAFWPESKLK